jgi:hypothetical protein
VLAETGIDPWILSGLLMGAILVVLITGAFLASERLFPTPRRDRTNRDRDQGEERRREEIRRYLDAIGEPFEEETDVEGFEVAFFLPQRDVAVTFDAKAFLRLRDTDIYPILVEHEMPGAHLGDRLPFETPTVGTDDADAERESRWVGGRWARGERRAGGRRASAVGGDRANGIGDGRAGGGRSKQLERERVAASFAVLGLGTDASEAEVRRAYRKRVKEVHPDQGGDEESFQRLQEAYRTARAHAE